jgi:hypothetical protein
LRAPPTRRGIAPVELVLEEEEDELDSAFERIATRPEAAPSGVGNLVEDEKTKEENASLFRQMAISQARPARDFAIELGVGPTTKQWLAIARPAVQNVRRAAEELGQSEISAALAEFDETVERVAKGTGTTIGAADRKAILERYQKLEKALPEAFELKGERDRREPIVVHHLLQQIPGVHTIALDRLYGAGLTSIESLYSASVEDLVGLARVERDVADAIHKRFVAFYRERAEHPVERAQQQVKQKLLGLVERLGKAHDDFQRAEAEDDRAAKRRARMDRRSHALEMNVLLAQLGELDLVSELERSPTERRIERVRTFVAQSGRAGNVLTNRSAHEPAQ